MEPLKSNGDGTYSWKVSQAEFKGYTRRALEELTQGMGELKAEVGKNRNEISKLKEKSAFWGAISGGIFGFFGGMFRGGFP